MVFITITWSIPLLMDYYSPSAISESAVKWCIRKIYYCIRKIYYCIRKILNNVIMNKSKVLLPQVYMTLTTDFDYLRPLSLTYFKDFKCVWLSNLLIMNVAYAGYSRNASCFYVFITIEYVFSFRQIHISTLYTCPPLSYHIH